MNGHQRTQSICLIIIAVGVVGACLYYLQSVLLPFVIALFIVVGCRPIAGYFEKTLHLHHLFAFALTFIVGLCALAFFALMTYISIQDLSRNREVYEARINSIAKWLDDRLPEEEDKEHSLSEISREKELNTPSDETDEDQDSVGHLLNQGTELFKRTFFSLAGSLSSLLSYAILILIYVFFLLLGNDKTSEPPELVLKVESKIRQFLVVKTVISAVTGFVFGLVLWLFGVPLAVLFGFLAFLLNFIPNIGPLISTLTPVPFLVLNSEMSTAAAVSCFVLIGAIQFISGNVVETRIMGKSFDVNPIALLLALMFFGQIWGIAGMFLATPIISIVKIVLDQRESTKGLGALLEGRLDVFATGDR